MEEGLGTEGCGPVTGQRCALSLRCCPQLSTTSQSGRHAPAWAHTVSHTPTHPRLAHARQRSFWQETSCPAPSLLPQVRRQMRSIVGAREPPLLGNEVCDESQQAPILIRAYSMPSPVSGALQKSGRPQSGGAARPTLQVRRPRIRAVVPFVQSHTVNTLASAGLTQLRTDLCVPASLTDFPALTGFLVVWGFLFCNSV